MSWNNLSDAEFSLRTFTHIEMNSILLCHWRLVNVDLKLLWTEVCLSYCQRSDSVIMILLLFYPGE